MIIEARLRKLEHQLGTAYQCRTHLIALHTGESNAEAQAIYEQTNGIMVDDRDLVIFVASYISRRDNSQ